MCRNAGLQLFGDADHPPCPAIFGDITSDDFLPPAAGPADVANHPSTSLAQEADKTGNLGHLVGTVQVASSVAVLHVLPEEGVTKLLTKVSMWGCVAAVSGLSRRGCIGLAKVIPNIPNSLCSLQHAAW